MLGKPQLLAKQTQSDRIRNLMEKCVEIAFNDNPKKVELCHVNMFKISFTITSVNLDYSPALEWTHISESTNCEML